MIGPRILIAGIGNIFFGDDAFGVEVARRLSGRELPAEVKVVDFGIRGFDLAYALLEDYELAILVDATPRGGVPGTLYLIEPELPASDAPAAEIDTHSMTPAKVLRLVATFGTIRTRILVVGCEPTPLSDDDEMQMGLSPAVEAALDAAELRIEALIAENLAPA